jgi:precorrin-4 methylase
LAELNAAGVDYAVVGGVAVIANGYSRLTEDLDIELFIERVLGKRTVHPRD